MRSRDVDGSGESGLIPSNVDGCSGRPHDRIPSSLVLRTPPNWTAAGFLSLLAFLHLSNAGISFFHGRYEGYLSLFLGIALAGVAAACGRFRFEVALLGPEQRLRLRRGVGRLCWEQSIPFASVRGVRLTLSHSRKMRGPESRIELLCPYEDVECPPTQAPRQEALFLAMLMKVPLIRVMDDLEAVGAPQTGAPRGA